MTMQSSTVSNAAAAEDSVIAAAGLSRTGAKVSRNFDWVIVLIALFLITGAFHLHYMLLAGDWDFWVDWKDRQFWPTVAPAAAICFPAALQYFLWTFFRVPFGATLCIVALMLGEWINRVLGFHYWARFPYSLIWPSLLIPSALFLDAVLLLTRNWLMTAIFGAWGFGLLFYPSNWVMLAQYHLPVEHMGETASVADMVGYAFPRSATPEYLRFIERGTLRTFGGHSSAVAAFFSAFLCMVIYIGWWFIGWAFSKALWVANPLASYMGLKSPQQS